MALKKCKECGNQVSNKSKTCPKCGAPQGRTQYGCGTFIGVLIIGWIFSIVISNIIQSSSKPITQNNPASQSRPSSGIGSDVTLGVSSGDVVICVDKAAYSEFLKLAVAKDYLGMAQMETGGRLFRVPSGTKAKIIDIGFEIKEVRIMEGDMFGRSGWVTGSVAK